MTARIQYWVTNADGYILSKHRNLSDARQSFSLKLPEHKSLSIFTVTLKYTSEIWPVEGATIFPISDMSDER